ncbi:hypothetical protein WN990_15290 [Kitasatospora purpeofusca]|uniref:hypothetical protein n=1 Tax=Kitasatospora purpeofusca TaxID=67352 RepID=UPI0030F2494F
MSPEEDIADLDRTAAVLQECWLQEGSVIRVLRLLLEDLGPSDDVGETAFGAVVSMHHAFDLSLGEAKRISRWHAIGGDLSDTEIEQRIGALVPRAPEQR